MPWHHDEASFIPAHDVLTMKRHIADPGIGVLDKGNP
jgi:hypothetical protein